jgi:thioredoxin 1
MFATRNIFNTARTTARRSFHVSVPSFKVTEVTSAADFRETVLKSPIAFVDFYATWCGPCKMIAPYIEKFSEAHPNIDFYKLDVDEISDITSYYGVSAMPTFLLFKQGEVVEKIVGANPQGINNALVNAGKSN